MQRIARTLKRLLAAREGQSMTEYAIVLALVAVAAIGAVSVVGRNVRTVLAHSANALAGQDTAASGDLVKDTHRKASREATFQNFSKRSDLGGGGK